MSRHLWLGISTVFVFWLTLAVGVAVIRVVQLLPDYFHWHWWGTPKRQIMAVLPGFVMLGLWCDYQRVYAVSFVLGHGELGITPSVVLGLAFGTAGIGTILWPVCTAVLGERDGHALWLRVMLIGLAFGLLSMVIYGGA